MAATRLNEDDDGLDNCVIPKSSKQSGVQPKGIATPAPGINPEDDDSSDTDEENQLDGDSTGDENALDTPSDEDNDKDDEPKQFQNPNKNKKKELTASELAAKKKKKDAKIHADYYEGGNDGDEEDENDEKDQPEWKKYWTKKELYGRYEPSKELGRGSYGVVFEGKSIWNSKPIGITTGIKVAIKKVRRVFNTDTDAKRLLRELKILRTLRGHQSIVKLYDILPPIDPANFKTLTIVFEYVDADLSKIFKTNQYFSALHVQYMLYHLILGINYMHTAGIIHRDLKPANVLINADCSIKICDFGLARGFSEDVAAEKKAFKKNKKNKKLQRGLTTHVVTRWYRAPEVILLQQKKEYLQAIDMWSIGCIFGELLQMQKDNCSTVWKRGPLFPGDSCFPLSPKRSKKKGAVYQSHFDQIRVVFEVLGTPSKSEINSLNDEQARAYLEDLPKQEQQNLGEMFPGTNKDGITLLLDFLKFDVKKRITVSEALNHPYFARVRDIDLEAAHPKMKFDFEGIPMKRKELHSLILKETLYYHPYERSRFEKSGLIKPLKNKKVKKLQKNK